MEDNEKQSSSSNFKELSNYELRFSEIEEEKHLIKSSEMSGTVVLFDMTSSTNLKQARGFPGWVSDLTKFYRVVFKNFLDQQEPENKIQWSKFLGDAYMFFFPDKEKGDLPIQSATNIVESCERVMNEYWNFYSVYAKKEKGGTKPIDFREMTCAIDYGEEIINWYEIIDDSKDAERFDPIGAPIDRCFRISNIAGPGQILLSNDFYEKKLKPSSSQFKDRLKKLYIAEKSLKGFPDEKAVYYLKPPSRQIDYILNERNVELTENIPMMSTKVKIKLLRERLRKEREGSNEYS